MRMIKQHRRMISWMILGAFLFLVQASAAPPAGGDELNSSEEKMTVSAATAEDDAGIGAVEKVEANTKVSRKKFPWLLIAAGVVAIGAVLYFTMFNKPYTLSVTLNEGVEGTPAAGNHKYKKGKVVNYDFSTKAGHKALSVTLDGEAAPASGSITMDSDHTLSASASEGIDEQFTNSASNMWIPWHPAFWSVSNGYYKCNSDTALGWEYNTYNSQLSSSQFVTEVKMCRTAGGIELSNGIGLVSSTSGTNVNGYIFVFNAIGSCWIMKCSNYNLETFSGSLGHIKIPTFSGSIHTGLNQWNTLRVIRSGSDYTLLINGSNVFAFNDSDLDPRYVMLINGCYKPPNTVDYDYVIATPGSQLAHAASAAPAVVITPGCEYNPLTGECENK